MDEVNKGADEVEVERMISCCWDQSVGRCVSAHSHPEASNGIEIDTHWIAPIVTWIRGYISGFSSLSSPVSASRVASQALASVIDQKSTVWTNCQL